MIQDITSREDAQRADRLWNLHASRDAEYPEVLIGVTIGNWRCECGHEERSLERMWEHDEREHRTRKS